MAKEDSDYIDFYRSCEQGNMKKVIEMCEMGINVNWKNPAGYNQTGLHIACWKGMVDVVRYLLTVPTISVNEEADNGETPFYCACYTIGKTSEVVKLLLQDARVDPNKGKKDGRTPLHTAGSYGKSEIVKILLRERRIEKNALDSFGRTPFRFSCDFSNLKVMRIFLEDSKVDVNKADNNGQSPLIYACRSGKIQLVKYLLASGREINTSLDSLPDSSSKNNAAEAEDTTSESSKLIKSYQTNPLKTIIQLRKELGWGKTSEYIFALVIFICDGFLKIDESEESNNTIPLKRFFRIATSLHMDLQLVLVNRSIGLPINNIPITEREIGFHLLASDLNPDTESTMEDRKLDEEGCNSKDEEGLE